MNHALRQMIWQRGAPFTYYANGKRIVSQGVLTDYQSVRQKDSSVSPLGIVSGSVYLLIALPQESPAGMEQTLLRMEGKQFRIAQYGQVGGTVGVDYFWATLLPEQEVLYE